MIEDKSVSGSLVADSTSSFDVLFTQVVPEGQIWYLEGIEAHTDGNGNNNGGHYFLLAAGPDGSLQGNYANAQKLGDLPRGGSARIGLRDEKSTRSASVGGYAVSGDRVTVAAQIDDSDGAKDFYSARIRRIL